MFREEPGGQSDWIKGRDRVVDEILPYTGELAVEGGRGGRAGGGIKS
jgi:hypothetical protein